MVSYFNNSEFIEKNILTQKDTKCAFLRKIRKGGITK